MSSIRAPVISTVRQLNATAAYRLIPVVHKSDTARVLTDGRNGHVASGQSHLSSTRALHTATPSMGNSRNGAPIDLAYMPRFEYHEPAPPEITRAPLLPDNYTTRNGTDHETIEPVMRPEISTVSCDSTHIESPSAMSEVTDNHSVELDPFNLTSKVAAAARMAGVPVEQLREPGVIKKLWDGLMDDLLGSNKPGKASSA